MFHSGDDDEEEPHDEDDADELHQVPEEESKVANQHRSSVDMTAHPQVIACHHTMYLIEGQKGVFKFRHNQVGGNHIVKFPDSRFRRGAKFSE